MAKEHLREVLIVIFLVILIGFSLMLMSLPVSGGDELGDPTKTKEPTKTVVATEEPILTITPFVATQTPVVLPTATPEILPTPEITATPVIGPTTQPALQEIFFPVIPLCDDPPCVNCEVWPIGEICEVD